MRTSLFLSLGVLLISSVSRTDAQQSCNGYTELCSKTYDKVAYATAHNAYANSPGGGLATNQDNDIPTQLKDGIRAFMLDAYNVPSGNLNDIELCHTDCKLFDGGLLSKTLSQIKTFMDANPNEIVTLLFENSQKLAPARFQTVYAAVGLDKYSHVQAAGNKTWPTLAQMISSKKRLVSFIDTGADATVPWLMPEYSYVFETPWLITKGSAYPCTVDRPKDQRQQMYVLNHFIYGVIGLGDESINFPQPAAADQTNGPDLVGHVKSCQTIFKQIPSFIAVDYYQKGSIFQTLAQVNNVKWVAKSSSNSATDSTADSGKGSGPNKDTQTKGNGGASTNNNKRILSMTVLVGVISTIMLF
ncbi:hypothetical protein BGZ76_011642 [Entomortierella beljakovae]|nr:hypothetical protein BGZ76_011642 [Entomortierella beljakovae]